MAKIRDIQSLSDKRGWPIDMVGIKGLALPVYIATKNRSFQQVQASINFFVNLSQNTRGTHMSRFVEILNSRHFQELNFSKLMEVAGQAKKSLGATEAYLEVAFTFFANKISPISKKKSLMDYQCRIISRVNSADSEQRIILEVPVTLLCPCSKEISKYSAHNQRAIVTVSLLVAGEISLEDLVSMVEKESSCQIYPLLKRPDEKHVTERSYENPKFVEDVVRDVASRMKGVDQVTSFSVECESFESVHNHSAYAKINFQKKEEKC